MKNMHPFLVREACATLTVIISLCIMFLIFFDRYASNKRPEIDKNSVRQYCEEVYIYGIFL